MKLGFAIRDVADADYALLPDLELRADAVFNDMPEFAELSDQDGIVPGRAEDFPVSSIVWIAEFSDIPCGFVFGHDMDNCLYIAQISVVPEVQGQGVGTALLERARRFAQETGKTGVVLTTYADIPFNGPFYVRRGYRVLKENEMGPELRYHAAEDNKLWGRFSPRVTMGLIF